MDNSAHDLGESLLKAQAYMHTLSSGELTIFCKALSELVSRWALHPKGRNWDFIHSVENLISNSEFL